MKIRDLSSTVLALLISFAFSEVSSRRASAADDGPLSRDRGLAEGENAAVGVVLRGVTGAQADVPQASSSRRYSPDYYRAYPQRSQTAGPAQKVAVAPAPAKPAAAVAPPVVAPKIVPVPTVAPAPKKIAPAPTIAPASKIAPLRVAVMPPGIDRSGAAIVKVAAKPTPTPAPKVAPTPKIAPLRVAVMPPGIDRSGAPIAKVAAKPTPTPAPKPRRVATPPTPVAKPRKGTTQPPAPEPVRVLFR